MHGIYPRPYPIRHVHPYARIGQVRERPPIATDPPDQPQETFTLSGLGAAIRQVTPTLLIVGVATGMALAIGSGIGSAIVTRYFGQKG